MKTIFTIIICLSLDLANGQVLRLKELSTTEIAGLDRSKTVVLLPGGILEEHGPYLPSFCDGYANEAMAEEIANSIVKRKGWTALIFPTIPLGVGGANEIGEKYSFAGTYAIRSAVLRSIIMDWGTELGQQGFTMAFIIHLHGSPNHNRAIDQACQYFSETYHGKMINVMNLEMGNHTQLRTEEEKKEDGFSVHADMGEHSVLYFLKPEFMRFNCKAAPPVTATDPANLVAIAHGPSWPGYFGSPRLANPAFGKKYWRAEADYVINQVNKVLDNTYDFSRQTYYEFMSSVPPIRPVIDSASKHEKEQEAAQSGWLKAKGYE